MVSFWQLTELWPSISDRNERTKRLAGIWMRTEDTLLTHIEKRAGSINGQKINKNKKKHWQKLFSLWNKLFSPFQRFQSRFHQELDSQCPGFLLHHQSHQRCHQGCHWLGGKGKGNKAIIFKCTTSLYFWPITKLYIHILMIKKQI